MAQRLKPLAGYVLIEPIDERETTASGLVMPEKAKEKPEKGRVITVGDPIPHSDGHVTWKEHTEVEKGNIVCFHRWSGQDVREGQKEYKLVKFSDLMGVYE